MVSLRPFLLWNQNSWPNREVVGEHYRAEAIRSLFPSQRRVAYEDRLQTVARLVPEPSNPHDRDAVAVYVDATHVGYLSREDARLYQPVITNLNRTGFEAQVPCEVTGADLESTDVDRRGRVVSRMVFSPQVRICLDEWYRCVPVNPAPPNHALLPVGAALQAQREEDHQDLLRRYLNANGECWVYGTLHEISGGTEKAPKRLVEIRIDGSRAGQLTAAMSAHYLPTIEALAQRSRTTAAQLIVKGNDLKVEVVLYAARAHDLDSAWVQRNAGDEWAAPRPKTFNPAPGWPPPPPGWSPPADWRPDPSWPPAPPGWRFWI